MIDRGKHNVLGVRIDAVDYEGAVERVIGHIRARYGAVVLDAAPVLPYPDTVAIAPHLDGMVLVLEAQRDKWETAQRSERLLERAGSRAIDDRSPSPRLRFTAS